MKRRLELVATRSMPPTEPMEPLEPTDEHARAPEPGPDATANLLRRWQSGDSRALELLLEENLPWVCSVVRGRLGPRLRAKVESQDVVQEVLLEFLRYGQRVVVSDRAHFRALLARIAENVIRGESDRFRARRRALSRERPLDSAAALHLDGGAARPPSPSQEAARLENEALVRLGLELVEPADREVIDGHDFEGLAFADLGARLGISADAARMRYHRAVLRLSGVVARIRAGGLERILADLAALDGEPAPAEESA